MYEIYENVATRDFSSSLTLKIENEESFANNYTCFASNEHGRSNQTYVLVQQSELVSDDAKKSSDISMIFTALIASLAMFLNHVWKKKL